jgi:hypothetical protein
MLPKSGSKQRLRPDAPLHVLGYTGYRRGVSDCFGESFNRTEMKVCNDGKQSYEAANYRHRTLQH